MSRFGVYGSGPVRMKINGSRLVTWSEENVVKSFENGIDKSENSVDILGEIRSCVTQKLNDEMKLIVATDQWETEAFDWPGLSEDSEHSLFRFAADISCLESYESSDQSRDSQIAAGAGDFKIKWKVIGQNSDEPTTIVGHEAPILSIALDPQADLIASSSCDGTFRVFRLADQSEVHKEKLWEKSSDVKYAKCPGTVLIEPENGELFAVLCSDSIRIISRDNFSLFHKIDTDGKISCLAWSSDGTLFATGSEKGKVEIYNAKSWMVEADHMIENGECISIGFLGSNLLVGGQDGHVTQFNIPKLTNQKPKSKSQLSLQKTSSKTSSLSAVSSGMEIDQSDEDMADQSEDEEKRPTNAFVEDEAGEDAEAEEVDDLEALWEEGSIEGEPPGEDLNQSEVGNDESTPAADISLEAIKKSTYQQSDIGSDAEQDGNQSDVDAVEDEAVMWSGPKPSKMQPAFQPGSTPNYNADRFLCWNRVGIVKGIIDTKKGISSIIVEFHNIMTHHSIQLQNKEDFSLADLSDTCLILASTGKDREEGEAERSTVKCLNYKTWWDKNKEWNIELPKLEFADAVAASSNWVAVATSTRYVRFYSSGGAQIQILSIPGQICTVTANQEQLFYTYHRALGYEDNQLLSCGIISLEKNSSHLSIPSDLCLSKGSSLSWIGFTDEGTPACYDTAGIVRIVNWYARSWMPVANTKKAKAARFIDHWWIISLSEGNKELCAILCKNSLFPEVFPRPEIEVLPMNVPLINPKTDLSVQEADLMVNRNLEGTVTALQARGYDADQNMQALVQKQITKTILKMLLGAIQQDADDRGYEICTMLENSQQVQMAIRLANQKRRPKLAEKLRDLARQKDEQESEESEDSDEEVNEVVENGFSQGQMSRQFQSKTRIDTDTSSRHSEDLFASREITTEISTKKTLNPFAKKKPPSPEPEDQNTPPSDSGTNGATSGSQSVFESMAKPEIKTKTGSGMDKKSMRAKLANLRQKTAKKKTEQKSILNFGNKRKMSEEEESEPKKQKSALRTANPASTAETISSMDQFAASDDE